MQGVTMEKKKLVK